MSKKAAVPTPSILPGARKKRGDTPEKLSPAASAEPNDSKRIDIIWDEALENLRIKEADWDHPDSAEAMPEERRSYSVATVAVKKRKQQSTIQDSLKESLNGDFPGALSNRKKVVVVKVAPETSKVEEFSDQVTEKSDMREQTVRMKQPSFSLEKGYGAPYNETITSSIVHHERRMWERHNVQDHLMTELDRKPHELAMNVEVREKGFQRDMVDRLLPFAEMKGYGFWKGAEFWRQHKWIGGEERGIFDTPGQVQRGFPAPVERANVSDAIRAELGLPESEPPVPAKLAERFRQLKKDFGLAGDLEPHTPDLRELVILPHREPFPQVVPDTHQMEDVNAAYMKPIVGFARNGLRSGAEILSQLPDVLSSAPVPGPALRVCDQLVKPVQPDDGETEMPETRLVFECMAGGTPCKNNVELTNTGTTVVFYSWRRLPVENTFKSFSTQPLLSLLASNPLEKIDDVSKIPSLPPVPPQRFYFDATDGVLLPGAKINLPVVFKSALAGVFTERWLLTPTPPAMSPIVVNFRGVAAQPDIHAAARAQLTAELSQREAFAVCRALVRSLVDGVRTPPRPSSPIGAPGRRQKGLAFRQQNADIHFDWQKVGDMEKLWASACQIRCGVASQPSEGVEVSIPLPPCEEWDWSVDAIYNAAIEPPPEEAQMDEEAMEQVLAQLNDGVTQLGFSEIVSQYDQKDIVGRILVSTIADSVAEQAISLRQALGLPPPPDIQVPVEPETTTTEIVTREPTRPTSSVQGGRIVQPGAPPSSTAASGKAQQALAHRGSAGKGGVRPQGHPSATGDSATSPPTSSNTELGIIRSPTDLNSNVDPQQALLVAKYVDKLQTTSRNRIKDLIYSLVDNVADLVDKRGNFSVPK